MSTSQGPNIRHIAVQLEKLAVSGLISRSLIDTADVELSEAISGQVAYQFSTYVAARSHRDQWTEEARTFVAPGVRNNIAEWLNTQWPFSRLRQPAFRVVWISSERVVRRQIAFMCPHIDIPYSRDRDIHFSFLETPPPSAKED